MARRGEIRRGFRPSIADTTPGDLETAARKSRRGFGLVRFQHRRSPDYRLSAGTLSRGPTNNPENGSVLKAGPITIDQLSNYGRRGEGVASHCLR